MLVSSIETENFRLLESQRVEFTPGVNIICGENAQGKTTLLEAVYLLTGVKSFRTRFEREIIQFDKDMARVEGHLTAGGREQKMEILFQRGKTRVIHRNGARVSPSRVNEALKAVLFSPEDLTLVRGGAATRRHLLDEAISQLRPGYAALISDYNKIFENKTRILKDWNEKPSLLDTLDDFSESMAMLSARIIRYRASFAQRLQTTAESIHRDFSGGREKLDIAYSTVSTVTDPTASQAELFEEIMLRQRQLRQAELDAGQCLVGIHKDDLVIAINGNDARTFASQGQARTAALSMKLAERDIFTAETGEDPILLLDDVLSEVDAARQEFVLNRIHAGQTLVTCCELASVERLTGGTVLRMEKGRVD